MADVNAQAVHSIIDLTSSPNPGRKSPSASDLSAGVDELIVDNDKVPMVLEAKDLIKNTFNVEIKLGLVSTDKWGEKRWIDFHGPVKQRKQAKVSPTYGSIEEVWQPTMI